MLRSIFWLTLRFLNSARKESKWQLVLYLYGMMEPIAVLVGLMYSGLWFLLFNIYMYMYLFNAMYMHMYMYTCISTCRYSPVAMNHNTEAGGCFLLQQVSDQYPRELC